MTPHEKQVAGLNFAGHGLVHLFEGVIPPLIPLLMTQFGASYFQMGMVVTVFTYMFGFGSLPAGWLADRIGSRRLITIYLFTAGCFSVLVIAVREYTGYIILMGLVGLAASIYHPAGSTMISHETEERGKAFGIYGMGGSLGIAVVPLFAAFFGTRFGWRVPHIAIGVTGIAIGFWSLSGRRRNVVLRSSSPEIEVRERRGGGPGMLILLFASFALLGMAYKGLTTFLPVYMAQSAFTNHTSSNPVTLGGAIVTVVMLFGLLGQYVGGAIADRVAPEYFYAATTFVAGVFALLIAFTTGVPLIIAAVVQAFFAFASQPIQNLLVSRHLSDRWQGVGFGIKFFMLFGVGSVAAAFAGYLADRFGLHSVFIAMGILYIAGSIAGLHMGRRTRAILP